MIEINIPDQYKSLYGFNENGFTGIPKNERRSRLGDKLWKEALSPGVWEFMPVTLGGVQLWNPILRIVGRKTIIETPLVERRGSVKEMINIDDYIINIRGTIKRSDGVWPDEDITLLKDLYERNETIPINSVLTSIFLNGNENVVIRNINMPEQPGKVESALYELECVSDTPFELEFE